jgi:hypothetical protein
MRVHAFKHHSPAPAARSSARRTRSVRDFRARGKLSLVIVAGDSCVACEATIDRFDGAMLLSAGRCCACHAELDGL